jgi:hypothetical protein
VYQDTTKAPGCSGALVVKSCVFLVPEVGFEPTHGCPRRILSPLRLPFRHSGVGVIVAPKVERVKSCPPAGKMPSRLRDSR